MTQHKASKTLSFKSLEEALATPGEFLFSDFSKLERPALLHLGFQALDAFQVKRITILSVCIALAICTPTEQSFYASITLSTAVCWSTVTMPTM